MSYRSFLIFVDDNHVEIGEAVQLPPDVNPFTDTGMLYKAESVDATMSALARRYIMQTAVTEALSGNFQGIGSHGPIEGAIGSPPSRLLPRSVSVYIKVRMLTRVARAERVYEEGDDEWCKRRA